MKAQIENLYINAVYNDEAPSNFSSKILELIGEDEQKQTRSVQQSRARWKYLTMVANILNDKGYSFKPIGLDTEIQFTKDLLYHAYWQPLRETLYPKEGKRKRQLNTSEFGNLADHAQSLFAMVFDVQIPFPNIEDYLRQKEEEVRNNGI